MPRFKEKTIEEIRNRITIKDVVSPYLRLIQKGSTYWAKCPFHGGGNEKTPSFKIDIDKGTYYCFGCHASGNMFSFLMNMEHMSFPEAVEYLADKTGVALESTSGDYDRKQKNDKEILTDLYERLSKTFVFMLNSHNDGAKAREYLEKRCVTVQWSEKFLLGYAPADPDFLYGFLHRKGYSDEILAQSGLFSRNNPRWPLFSDRLMFPVRNVRGQVIAFSGRDLSGRENAPKYINSPDTLIFSKKMNLFGLYESVPELKKKDSRAILCEGNFDVIAMHQAGMTTAVASLGTSFTQEQARLISRYTNKVSLLFDSDEAGQKSTDRVIDIMQKMGFDIQVHRLTQCKDASETLEKMGSLGLKKDFESYSDAYQYLVQKLLKHYNIEMPREKSALLREISPFLLATPTELERDAYIKDLAFRLDTSEEVIRKDLSYGKQDEQGDRRNDVGGKEEEEIPELNQAAISPEFHAMLLLASRRDLFKIYRRRIGFGDLKDRNAQILYSALENSLRDEVSSDELFLAKIGDDRVRNYVSTSFALDEYRNASVTILDEIIDGISLHSLEETRARLNSQIALSGSDEEKLVELLESKKELDKEISALKNKLYNGEGV